MRTEYQITVSGEQEEELKLTEKFTEHGWSFSKTPSGISVTVFEKRDLDAIHSLLRNNLFIF